MLVKNRFYTVADRALRMPGESVEISPDEYERLVRADAIYPVEIIETAMQDPAPEHRRRGRRRAT